MGHTEIVDNNLEPDFAKGVEMDYFFHRDQMLKFQFIDNDDGTDPNGLAEGEEIGAALIGLAQIMAAEAQTVTAPLFLYSSNGSRK